MYCCLLYCPVTFDPGLAHTVLTIVAMFEYGMYYCSIAELELPGEPAQLTVPSKPKDIPPSRDIMSELGTRKTPPTSLALQNTTAPLDPSIRDQILSSDNSTGKFT